jgi:hypothetical protein
MNEQLRIDVAEWLSSWAYRLENAYNAGIDNDGWPRFQLAMKHFDNTGKLTPGAIEYLTNRDPKLGVGKLTNYNTHRGLHRVLGSITPAPLKAIILGGLVDWSIGGAKTTEYCRHLEKHIPDWQFNARTRCWQGVAKQSAVSELFV